MAGKAQFVRHAPDRLRSGKQKRRQLAPCAERRGIGIAPRLEELEQLLARTVIVPLAAGLHDEKQLIGRIFTPPLRVTHLRKIEPGLIIIGISLNSLFEFNRITDELDLVGQCKTCFQRPDGRRVLLVCRNLGQNFPRLFRVAGFQYSGCTTADCIDIFRDAMLAPRG